MIHTEFAIWRQLVGPMIDDCAAPNTDLEQVLFG